MTETLIFDSEGIGVTMNSPLAAGQFAITIEDRSRIAHFPVTPKRYKWDSEQEALVERPEWASEEAARVFAKLKADTQSANKAACRAHILARYSAETQRNAALVIYGEEYAATCADFIARCIAVEDAAFDAVAACTTAEEIAAIPAVVFPEV